MKLRMGGINYHTDTGGPWTSTEIFTSGCYKDCPGCFNPKFRDLDKGDILDVSELANYLILNVPYKKVTISGGEPFLQAEALTELCKILKEYEFTILCYSGYTIEELPYLFPHALDLLYQIDILVDGPYIKDLPRDSNYVGSTNQRIIDMIKTRQQNEVVLRCDDET